MGSYENIVKIEEMKRKLDEGDLLSAQKVLDTIEMKRIKNTSDLNLIAEVYDGNEKYEEASELYLKIYEKVKTRKSLFHLIDVLIKLNNTEDAQYYLDEYQAIAPKDFYRYIFRYKIDKLKGESFEHLIEILKELKKSEYTEEWAYELAKLYYKAGMEEECISECSDLELWFGEGTYVEKAKILKSYYSGGADKDKIMEEIKRRSKMIHNQQENDLEPSEEPEETPIEETEEEALEPNDMEESDDISDRLMCLEEDSEFTDDLKRDVLNFLVDESENSVYNGESASVDQVMDDKKMEYDRFDTTVETETTYNERVISESEEEAEEEAEEERMNPHRNTVEDETDQSSGNNLNDETAEQLLDQLGQAYQVDLFDIFGEFMEELPIKLQLAEILENIITDESEIRIVLITGSDSTKKANMAKDLALVQYRTGQLKSSKIAKIKAEKLNMIDIMSKKETLKDCCVVIEKAGDLRRKTMDTFLLLCQALHGDIIVILEEQEEYIDKLFKECPILMSLIKNRINLDE